MDRCKTTLINLLSTLNCCSLAKLAALPTSELFKQHLIKINKKERYTVF